MNSPDLPELELSDDDRKIVSLLEAEPPSTARHCFRSAVEHLRRALCLQRIDPAMAMFRGITAEEEAASGLMHALISRNYPRAELLRPRDHLQKHAVMPFLLALVHHLREIKLNGLCRVRLAITGVDGFDRLVVGLLLEGEELTAMPTPPLNFSVREGDGGGEFPNITRNVRALLGPTGYSNVRSFLRNEANLRNRILYAGPDGYPQVHDLQPEYLMQTSRNPWRTWSNFGQ